MSFGTANLQELFLASQGVKMTTGLAGDISAAGAGRAQSDYEARQLGMNARLAEMQADDALARGEIDASRYAEQLRGLQGSQRVGAAASGLDPDSGTPAALQAEASRMGALDILTMRNNALREAYGYKSQADQYKNASKTTRRLGRQRQWGGILTGGLNFLRQAGETAYTNERNWPRNRTTGSGGASGVRSGMSGR